MKRFATRQLVLMVLLAGCGPSDAGKTSSAQEPAGVGELRIAAASDLKFTLDEIIAAFDKAHPGARVTATYGSSGSFFAQLTNEGPFDLFLSADVAYPKKLIEQGQALPGSGFQYATGRIVVWVKNSSTLDLERLGIGAVKDPAVTHLAMADPGLAPYGRAAKAALQSLGLYEAVKDRLVLGDNIAQTAQFVDSGSADVGLLSLSLAMSPAMKDKGRYWVIPESAHPKIIQGGAILKWARDRSLANRFRAFLLSSPAQAIFKSHGFATAE